MIAAQKAVSDDSVKEMRALVNDLIQRGIPGGYYDMGHYIESGALGFKQDPELALKYYRKSADMGKGLDPATGRPLVAKDNSGR